MFSAAPVDRSNQAPCCVVLCYAVLCCAVLCCALRCAALCCVALWSVLCSALVCVVWCGVVWSGLCSGLCSVYEQEAAAAAAAAKKKKAAATKKRKSAEKAVRLDIDQMLCFCQIIVRRTAAPGKRHTTHAKSSTVCKE
jgi:hypothetical protein